MVCIGEFVVNAMYSYISCIVTLRQYEDTLSFNVPGFSCSCYCVRGEKETGPLLPVDAAGVLYTGSRPTVRDQQLHLLQ